MTATDWNLVSTTERTPDAAGYWFLAAVLFAFIAASIIVYRAGNDGDADRGELTIRRRSRIRWHRLRSCRAEDAGLQPRAFNISRFQTSALSPAPNPWP